MDLFVYGTLTDPDRASAVLGEAVEYGPAATLVGLRRVEGRYPTLVPADDRPRVEGRILRADRVDALDEYEGVEAGLYVRVTVPVVESGGSTGDGGVEVYVGDPDRLGVAGVDWPGIGGLADRVREYVDRGGVEVRVDR